MRLHRFFINEIIGDKKEITIDSADQVNQIRRVFRLEVGDSIIIFDGSGFDHECKIQKFDKDSIQLSIGSSYKSRYMPARDIYLCVGIVKKDTFEWIVEKATELGVTHIIPVMAERSEKKSLNMERLRKIAIEASEQCGRGDVPTVHEVIPLDGALDLCSEIDDLKSIVFHTEGENVSARPTLANTSPIAVMIGPEGGWSPAEISLFHKNKVSMSCLGRQVLRTETAVVSALSLIVFGK